MYWKNNNLHLKDINRIIDYNNGENENEEKIINIIVIGLELLLMEVVFKLIHILITYQQ